MSLGLKEVFSCSGSIGVSLTRFLFCFWFTGRGFFIWDGSGNALMVLFVFLLISFKAPSHQTLSLEMRFMSASLLVMDSSMQLKATVLFSIYYKFEK